MSEQERVVIFGMTREGKRQRLERLMREQARTELVRVLEARTRQLAIYEYFKEVRKRFDLEILQPCIPLIHDPYPAPGLNYGWSQSDLEPKP